MKAMKRLEFSDKKIVESDSIDDVSSELSIEIQVCIYLIFWIIFQDDAIDENWDWKDGKNLLNKAEKPSRGATRINIGNTEERIRPENRSLIASICQFLTNRTVRKRLVGLLKYFFVYTFQREFEHEEIKIFIARKLFKIDGILCDEQTKVVMVEKLITEHGQYLFRNEQESLKKKYGYIFNIEQDFFLQGRTSNLVKRAPNS